MADASFEVMILLGYLAITLMTVAIAAYAISVSYIAREKSKFIRRSKKRVNSINRMLELCRQVLVSTGSPDRVSVNVDTTRLEKEARKLRRRIFWLSFNAAVLFPCISSSVALSLLLYGILMNPVGFEIIIPASSVAMVVGFCSLLKTLKAVEATTLSPLAPVLGFYLDNIETPRLEVPEPKKNDFRAFSFRIENEGEERIDNIEVSISFPEGFDVPDMPGEVTSNEIGKIHTLADRIEHLDAGISFTMRVIVGIPRMTRGDCYEIPILIREKERELLNEKLIFRA